MYRNSADSPLEISSNAQDARRSDNLSGSLTVYLPALHRIENSNWHFHSWALNWWDQIPEAPLPGRWPPSSWPPLSPLLSERDEIAKTLICADAGDISQDDPWMERCRRGLGALAKAPGRRIPVPQINEVTDSHLPPGTGSWTRSGAGGSLSTSVISNSPRPDFTPRDDVNISSTYISIAGSPPTTKSSIVTKRVKRLSIETPRDTILPSRTKEDDNDRRENELPRQQRYPWDGSPTPTPATNAIADDLEVIPSCAQAEENTPHPPSIENLSVVLDTIHISSTNSSKSKSAAKGGDMTKKSKNRRRKTTKFVPTDDSHVPDDGSTFSLLTPMVELQKVASVAPTSRQPSVTSFSSPEKIEIGSVGPTIGNKGEDVCVATSFPSNQKAHSDQPVDNHSFDKKLWMFNLAIDPKNGTQLQDEQGNDLFDVDLSSLSGDERICPRKDGLVISRRIGEGYYGTIYEAKLKGRECAIKVPIRTRCSTGTNLCLTCEQASTLEREVACMRQLRRHRNSMTCDGLLMYWGVLTPPERSDQTTTNMNNDPIGCVASYLDPNVQRGLTPQEREGLRTPLGGSIVMDLVKGMPLYEVLYDRELYLSALQRRDLTIQFLQCVVFLHTTACYLHRDIKTANLIISATSSIRSGDPQELAASGSCVDEPILKLSLCDFGKAVVLPPNGRVTLSDNGGTPRYMPPEAFCTGKEVSTAIDIWPTACCIIELLGGPVPYEQNLRWDAGPFTMHCTPTVPNIFPDSLRRILLQCFEVDMDMRPSIDALLSVIQALDPADMHARGFSYKQDIV